MSVAIPASAVRIGTDLEGFSALLRPSDAQVTVTGRGPFIANITRMAFHDLWLQRATASSAWIYGAHVSSKRLGILFSTGPAPGIMWRGESLAPNEIALRSRGQDYCIGVPENSPWGAMSLPVETVARAFSALTGVDLPYPDKLALRITPSAMERLQRLHAAADHLARHVPDAAATAFGLGHALTEAMIDCLAGSNGSDDRTAVRRHDTIMRRLRTLLQERAEDEIYLPELCASVGVSARTLRACCHEYLGMGPKRFLMLRRMHRARRAFQEASLATSVTEIATSFGFWELGRFAVEYRRLFGESPSVTLRRPRR